MRRSTISVLTAALVILGLGACARATTASGNESAAPKAGIHDTGVQVRVENQNWNSMRIYVVRDGTTRRLGSVETFGAKTFRLVNADLTGAGTVQLEAQAFGSGQTQTTEPIQVRRGDVVTWTLRNNLGTSSFTVG